jgi:hypothetical protein
LPPSKEKKARESYVSLRSALIKSARLKTTQVVKREVIVPDPTAQPQPTTGKVTLVDFDKPMLVAHLAIKVVPNEPKPDMDDVKPD